MSNAGRVKNAKSSKPSILCLINARGGSKGVPGKNVRPMHGKPLIAYSIETARASKLISKVVVSTDDKKIADAACKAGAEVPFMRPAKLATDDAKQIDVIIHAVDLLERQGEKFDIICILQPTCPLRSVEDVDGTLELLIESGADSAITVTDVGGRHPATLYRMKGKKLEPYIQTDKGGVLRQKFEEIYWRTGAVYAMKRDVVMGGSLYGDDTRGYVMPEERCFNIDSPFDWDLCEAWLAQKKA